jgi:small-conductance mechanosensitive channel
MNEILNAGSILRKIILPDVLLILTVFVLARLVSFVIRWFILRLAERASPHLRLLILRIPPIVRLVVGIGAVAVIVPILIEPTFENIIVLITAGSLALAFTLKDYGSSLVAGMAAVLENAYQPGDWIEVKGVYGEVKSIRGRTTRIVTPDDTEVIIPHSNFWSTHIFNASGGNRSLLCVADFYLNPDHDAALARKRLTEVAETSSYRKPETPVVVIVLEKPWGTHYRVKAYVNESREQFLFLTDLTVRGKEAIRSLGIRFAQATFAETKN